MKKDAGGSWLYLVKVAFRIPEQCVLLAFR